MPPSPERLREAYIKHLLTTMNARRRHALYVDLFASIERTRPALKPQSVGLLEKLVQCFSRLIIGQDTNRDVCEIINQHRRVLLFGAPGDGKTTVLYKLLIDHALIARTDPDASLPVFISLQVFTGETSFKTFVREQLGVLRNIKAPLRLLLLLDGLDEMPRTARDGRDLVAELCDFLRNQDDWVVSCRTSDYQDELNALDDYSQIQLQPLSVSQIHDFVFRFYGNMPRLPDDIGDLAAWLDADERFAHQKTSLSDDRASALWHEMKGRDDLFSVWKWLDRRGNAEDFWGWDWPEDILYPDKPEGQAWLAMSRDPRRLMHLSRNPRMLTLICSLFVMVEEDFVNRGILFRHFVNVLRQRETARAQRIGAGNVDAVDMTLIKTHPWLKHYFNSEYLARMIDTGEDPSTIEWQSTGWWGFDEKAFDDGLLILADIRGEPERLARWVASAQPEMALYLLIEAGVAEDLNALAESTRQAILSGAHEKTKDEDSRERATAYRVLGVFDADQRAGVNVVVHNGKTLPDIVWSDAIPPGEYPLDEQLSGTLGIMMPMEWYRLKYDYRVSIYPVTNAQFQVFVDENESGYNNRKFWTKAGLEWKGVRRLPDDIEKGVRRVPGSHLYNHPRINVTWYEAMAFCAWLTERYQQAGFIGKDEIIRLPLEAEREIAARGKETDSNFIFKNELIEPSDLGNTYSAAIFRNVAVGVFHKGASWCGAQDMLGNVWELCLNTYARPHDGLKGVDASPLASRSLRDCGFVGDYRITTRSAVYPGFADDSIGFRVVRSQKNPSSSGD